MKKKSLFLLFTMILSACSCSPPQRKDNNKNEDKDTVHTTNEYNTINSNYYKR